MRSFSNAMRRAHFVGAAYQITDLLHEDRTVRVPAEAIVSTVSAWLAELGASSTMVDDLARTMCSGDWPAAHAIADSLSVGVAVSSSPPATAWRPAL